MREEKSKKTRKKAAPAADAGGTKTGVPMRAEAPLRAPAARLVPRLFALIVQDEIKACVWALSPREARGKGEIVLGGAEGRSFAASVNNTIFPVEVVSVRQRLSEALDAADELDAGELSKQFIGEASKAVLLQILGWKPAGFEAFSSWLLSQVDTQDLAQHFPLDEVYVMWEGKILTTAPTLADLEARFQGPLPHKMPTKPHAVT